MSAMKLSRLALILAACVALARPAPAAPSYAITDLGKVGAGRTVVGLNDSGQSTGSQTDSTGTHAFVLDAGVQTYLTDARGKRVTGLASALNNATQIVSASFLYDNGQVLPVNFSDPNKDIGGGIPSGINDAVQIVGTLQYQYGHNAFLYDYPSATLIDLGTIGGGGYHEDSGASAVNGNGHVTGYSSYYGAVYAFLDKDGYMSSLGVIGSSTSVADRSLGNGINNDDEVVGQSSVGHVNANQDAPIMHAFFWHSGKMGDLGTLGGINSDASSVNDSHQIVGNADTENKETHACLWENHIAADLNNLAGKTWTPRTGICTTRRTSTLPGKSWDWASIAGSSTLSC